MPPPDQPSVRGGLLLLVGQEVRDVPGRGVQLPVPLVVGGVPVDVRRVRLDGGDDRVPGPGSAPLPVASAASKASPRRRRRCRRQLLRPAGDVARRSGSRARPACRRRRRRAGAACRRPPPSPRGCGARRRRSPRAPRGRGRPRRARGSARRARRGRAGRRSACAPRRSTAAPAGRGAGRHAGGRRGAAPSTTRRRRGPRSQSVSAPEVAMPRRASTVPGSVPTVAHSPGCGADALEHLRPEHRRAVHEHHVAGSADADADRLGPGVDGARGDRRAGRQPGRGGGVGGHRADDLVGQASRGSSQPGRDLRRPVLGPPRPRPGRRAARTGSPSGGRARTRRSAGDERRSSPSAASRCAPRPRARGAAATQLRPDRLGGQRRCRRARGSRRAPSSSVSSAISAVARVSTP